MKFKNLYRKLIGKYWGYLPLPLRLRIRISYFLLVGKVLNLKNPKLFTEKLQWLKLNYYNPLYSSMVDKIKVKDYVKSKIGQEYVIPTYRIFDSVDEIYLNKLPSKFVLKTSNGGGGNGVIICNNINNFDLIDAKLKLNKSLNFDIYKSYKEWPYKDISKKIMLEKLIEDQNQDLLDYKFFCFNGVPKFLKVDIGRFSTHFANYYDLDLNILPYIETDYPPNFNYKLIKPKNFEMMIDIASKLSQDIPFVRVDLYNIDGHIYFGELTFFPSSGLTPWGDFKTDREIGNYLTLP